MKRLVQQHRRETIAKAASFRRLAESIDVRAADSAKAIERCKSIELLLLSAADEMEDLSEASR